MLARLAKGDAHTSLRAAMFTSLDTQRGSAHAFKQTFTDLSQTHGWLAGCDTSKTGHGDVSRRLARLNSPLPIDCQHTYCKVVTGWRWYLMSVWRTAVTIKGPPLAPRAATSRPWGSCTRVGDMELKGFLPGRMKLGALGASPYALACCGVLKSSIWLFNSSPAVPQSYHIIYIT